jgi:hypothetical protein
MALEMNSEFQEVLSRQMQSFNAPGADQLARVREQMTEIREEMVQNIDRIMRRQERIDLLVHKSSDLQTGALVFRRDATAVRRTVCLRNAKALALFSFGVAAMVMIYWLWKKEEGHPATPSQPAVDAEFSSKW